MVGNIWHILESSHERWNLMNIGMIKEVAYMRCHQSGRSSTQTDMSTCITMWIEVSRSNIVVHRLITGHWCILLTDHPPIMKMRIKVLECKLTSVNKCVEVKHLKGSINQGTLMYSQNYRWWEILPPMIASLKALKNDSRFLSQNKWSEVDGMESIGRRALRHPPSTNTR